VALRANNRALRGRSGHSFLGPVCWSMAINILLLVALVHGFGAPTTAGNANPTEIRISLAPPHLARPPIRLAPKVLKVAVMSSPTNQRASAPPALNRAQRTVRFASLSPPRLLAQPVAVVSTDAPVRAAHIDQAASPADTGVDASQMQSAPGGFTEVTRGGAAAGGNSDVSSTDLGGRRESYDSGVTRTTPTAASGTNAPKANDAAVGAGVTRAARIVVQSQPDYPEAARRDGVEGTVIQRISLDAAGAVQAVDVASSSGDRRLDEAARKQVAQWRFEPRLVSGVGTASSLRVRVVFNLTDDN